MKTTIAITGHTKGIGQAVVELMSEDYDTLGFSRSNGYDISSSIETIVAESKHCDIFINNAFHEIKQLELFNEVMKCWRHDSTKTIVNINSRAKYMHRADTNSYYNAKIDLFTSVHRNLFNRKCRVININPGYVMTDSSKDSIERTGMPYMSTTQCAEYIKWAIEQPVEIWDLSLWKRE